MKLKIIALAVILIVVGVACSETFNTEPSENKVSQFHQYLTQRQFKNIYAMATEGFMEPDSREEMDAYFNGVREKLGAFKGAKLQDWRINYTTSGKIISLTYASRYERGAATENFVFHESDDKPRLHSYNVNSRVFILQ